MRVRRGGKVQRSERWFDLIDGDITLTKRDGVGLGFGLVSLYHNGGDAVEVEGFVISN
jgi:hypothetical protein